MRPNVVLRAAIAVFPVCVLMTGTSARAQNFGGGLPPIACSVNTAQTPVVRTEGFTEIDGDLIISCLSGVTPGQSNPSPFITSAGGIRIAFGASASTGRVNIAVRACAGGDPDPAKEVRFVVPIPKLQTLPTVQLPAASVSHVPTEALLIIDEPTTQMPLIYGSMYRVDPRCAAFDYDSGGHRLYPNPFGATDLFNQNLPPGFNVTPDPANPPARFPGVGLQIGLDAPAKQPKVNVLLGMFEHRITPPLSQAAISASIIWDLLNKPAQTPAKPPAGPTPPAREPVGE